MAPSLSPSNPRTKHEGKTRRALREAEAGNEMASGVIYALTNLGQGGDFRDLSCPIVTLAVEVELFHAPRPDRSAEISRYVHIQRRGEDLFKPKRSLHKEGPQTDPGRKFRPMGRSPSCPKTDIHKPGYK